MQPLSSAGRSSRAAGELGRPGKMPTWITLDRIGIFSVRRCGARSAIPLLRVISFYLINRFRLGGRRTFS
jgi:hypothetical protein